MPLKSVIPGRRKAASPESMNTELSQLKRTGRDSAVRVHGFRAWPFGPSRNDRVWVWAVVNVIALSAVAVAYLALPGPALERSRHLSGLVLARDGSILRGFLSAEGKWRLTAIADSVDPLYRKMLLAAEDQRFATHPGIDALAVLRAFGQLASHGRIVSGASTLSMQVVRLLERRPRSLAAKAVEAAEALSLERHLAKEAILGLYLTLAPFGGNLEGVRAASLAYFGKEPNHQSPAEAALLVALSRAPERLRPDRHPEAARHARDAVLERMRDKGILSDTAVAEARAEAISRQRFALPFHAPHLARALRSEAPGVTVQQTTIDPLRQRQVEALLLRETTALDPQATLAALVIDNRERQVVAYIGNAEFGSTARHGTLDMARAVRSPAPASRWPIWRRSTPHCRRAAWSRRCVIGRTTRPVMRPRSSGRSPPGMSATFSATRRRRPASCRLRFGMAAVSPSKPARPTVFAIPGRSDTIPSSPSRSGPGGRTARRCRGIVGAPPPLRSCSRSPICWVRPRPDPPCSRRPARSPASTAICRHHCAGSSQVRLRLADRPKPRVRRSST